MTDDKLVEAVARAIAEREGFNYPESFYYGLATAAIAAVRQHTQNDWK